MTKKRFLCFALAAMLICGSVATIAPVYAEGSGGSSTAITLTLDKEAPTGEIAIDTNIWKEFFNAITFEKLFRTTKTVTITANDDVAVASVKYYVSEKALALEQVKALAADSWTEYTKEFQLGPPKSCVVYALITDTSGKETYLSSDGLVFILESVQKSNVDISGNVVNTTEDKTSGTEGAKVATTTAIVKTETKTAAGGAKTTTATVDTATAEKIVEKAVENKSEEVVVNTGAGVTETAAGSTTEIQLPEQTVQGLSQKTEASVTIKTEAAEVTLNKEAVDGLASQAGDDGYVKLVVETVKQDESAVQIDLKLVTSKGTVSDFRGGNVSVKVKLNVKLADKEVVCLYIDDGGIYNKNRIDGTKNDNGTFTFKTGHFSSYAIMAADEADKVIADQLDTLIKEVSLRVKTTKTSKKNIRVTVSGDVSALKDAGYTVKYRFCRSTRASGSYVGKKTKASASWTNTAGTKGTKYYYKAKVYVYDENGTKVGQTTLSQSKYSSRTWSK